MAAVHAADSKMAGIPVGTLPEICRELASRPYAKRGVPRAEVPIRVLLVDDHALVRAGIRALLRSVPDVTIVGEASDGRAAVELARRLQPQVILMDLDLPFADGATATRAIVADGSGARVLVLTMYPERERLMPMLVIGARGYLTKDVADRELVDAIRVVASGDVYVRPAVARELAASGEAQHAPVNESRAGFSRLSDRERTVVGLTARGFNGPEIGRQLGIAAKTVDTYKQRIEQKLGFSHRTDYVRFALDAQLLGAGR